MASGMKISSTLSRSTVFLVTFGVVAQVAMVWPSQPVNVSNSAANDRAPCWSPDGTQIAFESERDGNWEIYRMRAEGSDLQRVTNHSASDRFPAWSPDGDQLAFQSERFGQPELCLLDLESRRVSRLTHQPGAEIFPSWSPDGQKIAYSLMQDDKLDIYVTGLDGQTEQLTHDSGREVWPRWAPDGSQIVFFSRRDTNGEDDDLYIITLASGKIERVTNKAGHDFCPDWSPDGERLVCASLGESFERGIVIFDLKGKLHHILGRGYYRVTEPAWAPDGRRIAYIARQQDDDYDIFVQELAQDILVK